MKPLSWLVSKKGRKFLDKRKSLQSSTSRQYPEEFIKWIGFHTPSRLSYREIDDKWLYMINVDASEIKEYNLAELFEYWQSNTQ